MSYRDSVYNRTYGVRQESDRNGTVYYDRKGNSYYERSEAIRANERIERNERNSSLSRENKGSSDWPTVRSNDKKSSKNAVYTPPKREKPPLSKEDQAILDANESKYDRLVMFVDEYTFSVDDFINGADYLNIVVPSNVLVELKEYKMMDYRSLSDWEIVLSKDSVGFINQVHSDGVAECDEAYGVIKHLR